MGIRQIVDLPDAHRRIKGGDVLTLGHPTGLAVESRRTGSPLDALLWVIAAGFAAMGLRPIIDPDAWWHLRTGELVVHSGFTHTDPWSFASTNPWLLHEWGSEVAMYLSYAAGGYHGVMALHALAMLALGALVLRSVRREATPPVAGIVGAAALYGTFLGTAERPQLVSWILLAGTLPALRRWVRSDRAAWWLIPVTWAWANLHGLWVLAPVMLGLLLVGRTIEVGLPRVRSQLVPAAVPPLCVAAAGLTPTGPELVLAPLHVRGYAQFVGEWGPPTPLNPFFGITFVLLGVVLVGWAVRSQRPRTTDVVLLVGSCAIALPYIRTMPVVAIVVAPMAAEVLQRALLHSPPPPLPARRSPETILGFAFLAAAIAAAAVWLPSVPPTEHDVPVRASAYLDSLPGRARVLNEYPEGGWLLWTARDVSPAIDGRTEIYNPDYIRSLFRAEGLGDGWKDFIRSQNYDAAWLYRQSPLVFGLKSLGWTVGFHDAHTVVLLPPGD